jgi:hypothetical protein
LPPQDKGHLRKVHQRHVDVTDHRAAGGGDRACKPMPSAAKETSRQRGRSASSTQQSIGIWQCIKAKSKASEQAGTQLACPSASAPPHSDRASPALESFQSRNRSPPLTDRLPAYSDSGPWRSWVRRPRTVTPLSQSVLNRGRARHVASGTVTARARPWCRPRLRQGACQTRRRSDGPQS